jgi:hypothetical protein
MSTFKRFYEFVNESLAFLSLDKTMKNEFMNNIELKNDFENAKREFYMNGNFLLTHIEGDKFELRTLSNISQEDLNGIIDSHINISTERMKFQKAGKPKIDKIKEKIWILKAKID